MREPSPSDRADLDRLFPDGWEIRRRNPKGGRRLDLHAADGRVFEVVFPREGELIIIPHIVRR